MKGISYNIHGWLKIQINSVSWHLVRDLNRLYSYFEARKNEDPHISVEIKNFIPDLGDCYSLDHKYFIKRNYIFLKDSDKNLWWKVQIEGLEEDRIKVTYFSPKTIYTKFPWMFFPDLVLYLYVIEPLVEMMLLRKGLVVLHAGAVHRGGKAYLIAGRGGTHKTNFVLELMRRGFDYMSDDRVILSGKEVYSFPHSISLFDFTYRYLGREEMNWLERIKLFFYLLKNHPIGVNVVEHSELKDLTLLILTNKPSLKLREDFDLQGILRMLWLNQKMEKTSYVSHKTIIGKFLEAYRFVFPEFKYFLNEKEWENLLMESFQDIPFRVLEVPEKWEGKFVEELVFG